ncbi:hypothetical protein FACS1894145_4580 [Bacteroidia bacterium]|nr:hypothetical protein FACS1894145_4580 [Bacteroidia bacterium]
MKHLTVLLISILFSAVSFAKDLHFIYIRLDNSMDTEILETQIEKLKTGFANSDFVLYYSNENTTMDKQSWDSNNLFSLINAQNSSIAISIPDEIENISLPLENQLQEESYSTIYFDCFVGSSFFDNNYQDMLLARMLLVNSLIQSEYEVSLRYFPCGAAYTAQKTKFNSEYNIHLKTKIISAL